MTRSARRSSATWLQPCSGTGTVAWPPSSRRPNRQIEQLAIHLEGAGELERASSHYARPPTRPMRRWPSSTPPSSSARPSSLVPRPEKSSLRT